MVDVFEFKISSDPKYLKKVRRKINQLCKMAGFRKEERHSLILAVNEAVSNIIKHAYQNATDRPIIINGFIKEDRLEIVLRDFGVKANSKKIRSRKLEDVKPGGLGVHIIKSVMDEVMYNRTVDDVNQLILAKYLPGKKGKHVKV
jgi:anti-sigma regulatory factor (Ser/Thr protein kinase)